MAMKGMKVNEMRKFLKWCSVWALVLVLQACSTVKLNDVPVEDKSNAGISADELNAANVKSGISSVQAQGLGKMVIGPANVERVIYFEFDSYTLKADAQPVVQAHAAYLKNNKDKKISLEGNTDERGGSEYNLALGQKRADAVKKALSLLGVSESQIESVSFGKEKPAVQGSDENAFAKNRRVELSYR
jgi:peptidoglycan-associated lipoprotein